MAGPTNPNRKAINIFGHQFVDHPHCAPHQA
jgi:hypothetical protein